MHLERHEAESQHGWLGFLRFSFAVMCAFGFSSSYTYFAYEGVFGWIMVSGYSVARQWSCNYQPMTHRSLMCYLWDRFLSLYPLYWLVLCFGAFIAAHYSDISQMVFSQYDYVSPFSSNGALAWLSNISLIGRHHIFGGWPTHNFLPIAWLLSVLVCFWLLTPTLLHYRNARLLALYFGLFFVGFTYVLRRSGGDYAQWHTIAHSSMVLAILPYVGGVYAWLLRDVLRGYYDVRFFAGLAASFVLLVLFQGTFFADPTLEGLYVMQVVLFVVLVCVSNSDITQYAYWVRAMDRFLLGISYPMLLVCATLNAVFFALYSQWMSESYVIKDAVQHSFYLARLNVFFSLIISVMVYFLAVLPIEHLRARVRAKLRH